MILAEADPSGAFVDPTFWVNLGAVGVICAAFMSGKLHSTKEVDRIDKSHADAQQRSDDQVRQLILERDKANRERDEAISVMRDFTLMAGTIFDTNRPTWKPPPRKLSSEERDNDR